MHIPDGYLSPATCVTLYAGSAPFWYYSLKRIQRALHTRTIPLLSVFAAFSFLIMMFNLPLPGGTTGHAVGVTIATIVLGPWAAILTISTALLIQAVFFGDGGITAFGANCFNMAILGSLSSFLIYRLIVGRTGVTPARRVVAAAIAGYVSINIAALAAAIELGLQPLLYSDASGAPLYAPYPLRIAIPAMMIGHLTIAGIAELVVSAGVISYLQRAEPSLLQGTAPGASGEIEDSQGRNWKSTRPLWLALAVLMMATPLGILAAGTAWSEWSTKDLQNPQTRQQIVAASGNQTLPSRVPEGLKKLSSIWTAPMPAYSPAFLKSASFGYLLSAMMGTGLILFVVFLGGWVLGKVRTHRHGTQV
jgi:cobalt/nickel transport system permease protein